MDMFHDWSHWSSFVINEHIPISFFEKYFKKINYTNICVNKNVPISFFEEHIDHISLDILSENSFSTLLKNIQKVKVRENYSKVNQEIILLSYTPANEVMCIPKGGNGYLEMIGRYG